MPLAVGASRNQVRMTVVGERRGVSGGWQAASSMGDLHMLSRSLSKGEPGIHHGIEEQSEADAMIHL